MFKKYILPHLLLLRYSLLFKCSRFCTKHQALGMVIGTWWWQHLPPMQKRKKYVKVLSHYCSSSMCLIVYGFWLMSSTRGCDLPLHVSLGSGVVVGSWEHYQPWGEPPRRKRWGDMFLFLYITITTIRIWLTAEMWYPAVNRSS